MRPLPVRLCALAHALLPPCRLVLVIDRRATMFTEGWGGVSQAKETEQGGSFGGRWQGRCKGPVVGE